MLLCARLSKGDNSSKDDVDGVREKGGGVSAEGFELKREASRRD